MHIPDGYLSPQTYGPMYAVTAVFWAVALKKVRNEQNEKHIPYLGISAAFSFIIMMFNIPIPGGTTGHAVGAALAAIVLGPWPACLTVSVVLIIQALVFGDGGITAIGANCFNMAIVMPFASYWIFSLIRGKSVSGRRAFIAAFIAGYLGLCIAALFTGLMFGIQPLIASGPDGRPLYAPYPISVAVPVMLLEHLVLFGFAEGIITAMVLRYLAAQEPGLIYAMQEAE